MSEVNSGSAVRMEIEGRGAFTMTLASAEAPNTSRKILELARSGFYDGIRFHRVVAGFVAQAGDPKTKAMPLDSPGIGSGGSGTTVSFEQSLLTHEDGAVGLARSNDPDSGDSQFYICLGPHHELDRNYVVFGKVTDGMDVVRAIAIGDKIVSVTVE